MKKQMILLLALFSVITVHAQIRKIPAEVTEAFKNRFSNAEKVSWKDDVSSFEASFISNGVEMKADFSSKGEWKKTEKKLQFETLPEEVSNGFSKSKYTDWEIGSVTEVEENDKELIYRIFVQKSSINKKFLYFDAKGQLKKESKSL